MSQYPLANSSGNIQYDMASNTSTRPMKRQLEPDSSMAQASPHYSTTNENIPLGTQYNPVALDSSPELATGARSRKAQALLSSRTISRAERERGRPRERCLPSIPAVENVAGLQESSRAPYDVPIAQNVQRAQSPPPIHAALQHVDEYNHIFLQGFPNGTGRPRFDGITYVYDPIQGIEFIQQTYDFSRPDPQNGLTVWSRPIPPYNPQPGHQLIFGPPPQHTPIVGPYQLPGRHYAGSVGQWNQGPAYDLNVFLDLRLVPHNHQQQYPQPVATQVIVTSSPSPFAIPPAPPQTAPGNPTQTFVVPRAAENLPAPPPKRIKTTSPNQPSASQSQSKASVQQKHSRPKPSDSVRTKPEDTEAIVARLKRQFQEADAMLAREEMHARLAQQLQKPKVKQEHGEKSEGLRQQVPEAKTKVKHERTSLIEQKEHPFAQATTDPSMQVSHASTSRSKPNDGPTTWPLPTNLSEEPDSWEEWQTLVRMAKAAGQSGWTSDDMREWRARREQERSQAQVKRAAIPLATESSVSQIKYVPMATHSPRSHDRFGHNEYEELNQQEPTSHIVPNRPNVIAGEPDPVLSAEQQHVVDLIVRGHNVFYTGSAGCGKSTILKAFVRDLTAVGKTVRIVAPTNLAALNVNGSTTWNFAGWTPDSMKKPLEKLLQASHGKEVNERFRQTDVLVIDEISMVENLLFERLNRILKDARGDSRPFGGIQIVVTGDFCQLSPVKPFKHCIGCGWELIPDHSYRATKFQCENRGCNRDVFYEIDKWAFRSDAWQECEFKCVNLTEIHRQNDKKFISILQKIRTDGVILPPHAHILLNHTSETEDAIKIFARRDDVDRVNNENIAKLNSESFSYACMDFFDWRPEHRDDKALEKNTRVMEDGSGCLMALKEHRYEATVRLKQNMRVVLQANLDPQAGLVNGAQGTIIDFEPFAPDRLPVAPKIGKNGFKEKLGSGVGGPDLRGTHATFMEERIKDHAKKNRNPPWPIVQFDNGLTRTIYPDSTRNELGNTEPYSILSRTQVPLMAGYAITVHKCQGMTLERVIVDLARAFEPSQMYVALSRARSLKGLKVMSLPQRNLGGANPQVKEFFATYLAKKSI